VALGTGMLPPIKLAIALSAALGLFFLSGFPLACFFWFCFLTFTCFLFFVRVARPPPPVTGLRSVLFSLFSCYQPHPFFLVCSVQKFLLSMPNCIRKRRDGLALQDIPALDPRQPPLMGDLSRGFLVCATTDDYSFWRGYVYLTQPLSHPLPPSPPLPTQMDDTVCFSPGSTLF